MKVALTLLALLVASSGYFVNESFAEIAENQAYLLEGSGFAVTEENIKVSEIDLGLSSQDQRGSTINFLTEDGFITLDDEEFIISDLEGKFLREGRYIRINGDIESSTGSDTSISFFGRLIEESKDASVYGFTGRITTQDDVYKIIYTTKLSALSKITLQTESATSDANSIHIIKYSSTRGIGDVVPGQQSSTSVALKFFSDDRISIEPGTTITIVNDDLVSHSLVSGIVVGSERDLEKGTICRDVDTSLAEGFSTYGEDSEVYDCAFVIDDRIDTGVILPGESVSITFEESGFYRLIDPDYVWMRIIGYVFPTSDNFTFGEGQNAGN